MMAYFEYLFHCLKSYNSFVSLLAVVSIFFLSFIFLFLSTSIFLCLSDKQVYSCLGLEMVCLEFRVQLSLHSKADLFSFSALVRNVTSLREPHIDKIIHSHQNVCFPYYILYFQWFFCVFIDWHSSNCWSFPYR